MGREHETQLRCAVVALLEEKGFTVRDVSSGSGVPRLSRLEIADKQQKLTCAVKITTMSHGRISFTRNPDGRYKVLSDSDRVIYAKSDADDNTRVSIAMYDAATVQQAFDANFQARRGTEREDLPMWLSPDPETGERFIGSGFREKALWSEVRTLSGSSADIIETEQPIVPSDSTAEDNGATGIMSEIKTMLSEHMGVRPDQLEIDIRVRL